MLRTARPVSGESLSTVEGVPSPSAWVARINRRAGTLGAAFAVALAVAALAGSWWGYAQPGVEWSDGRVTAVDRSGFAWLDSVRPGQAVVDVSGGQTAGEGTTLTVSDGSNVIVSRSSPWDAQLRRVWPLAALALAVAIVAVPLVYARRPLGGLLVMAAVLLASEPIIRLHDRLPTLVAGSAVILAPAAFAGTRPWLDRRIRFVVVAAGAAFALAWVMTRVVDLPALTAVEQLHDPLAYLAFVGLVASEGAWMVRRGLAATTPSLQLVDAVSLALGGGIAAAAIYFRGADFLTLGLIVIAVLLYPRFRHLAFRSADRLLLSDVRERAAIESVEEERARLARDIHDTSLQELAGVIGSLETHPNTAAERASLRRVADQLRRMSTELRPPVLDDLGLGPALAFLADRIRSQGLDVTLAVDGSASFEPANRAPANVELAVFRIVEQALSNVVLHADASRVTIEGRVNANRVELVVRDDGRGIERADLEEAARRGRLGIASMRRRAELIGATLDVDGGPGRGTSVSVRWLR